MTAKVRELSGFLRPKLALSFALLTVFCLQTSAAGKAPGYMGCYNDSADRVLKEKNPSKDKMTPEACRKLCKGFTYFGVTYGSQCFCGNSFNKPAKHTKTKESDCQMPCNGNRSIMCGGYSWKIDIYKTYEGEVPGYIGCYKDSPDRVLNEKDQQTDSNTPETCRTFCKGYKFFGVTYGSQCFCGNVRNKPETHKETTESDCQMPCKGDSKRMCGGSNWRMDVYQTDEGPVCKGDGWARFDCSPVYKRCVNGAVKYERCPDGQVMTKMGCTEPRPGFMFCENVKPNPGGEIIDDGFDYQIPESNFYQKK